MQVANVERYLGFVSVALIGSSSDAQLRTITGRDGLNSIHATLVQEAFGKAWKMFDIERFTLINPQLIKSHEILHLCHGNTYLPSMPFN